MLASTMFLLPGSCSLDHLVYRSVSSLQETLAEPNRAVVDNHRLPVREQIAVSTMRGDKSFAGHLHVPPVAPASGGQKAGHAAPRTPPHHDTAL